MTVQSGKLDTKTSHWKLRVPKDRAARGVLVSLHQAALRAQAKPPVNQQRTAQQTAIPRLSARATAITLAVGGVLAAARPANAQFPYAFGSQYARPSTTPEVFAPRPTVTVGLGPHYTMLSGDYANTNDDASGFHFYATGRAYKRLYAAARLTQQTFAPTFATSTQYRMVAGLAGVHYAAPLTARADITVAGLVGWVHNRAGNGANESGPAGYLSVGAAFYFPHHLGMYLSFGFLKHSSEQKNLNGTIDISLQALDASLGFMTHF